MLAKCFPKVSLQSHLSWKSYGMDECAWNKCRNSTTEFNLFNWCDVAECAVWIGCCNLFHSFCLCNFIGWFPMSEYTISWYSKKLTYKEKLCYFNFFRSLACKNLSFSVWFFCDLVVEVSQKFLFWAGYCRDPCIILCYASHLSMLSHALLTKNNDRNILLDFEILLCQVCWHVLRSCFFIITQMSIITCEFDVWYLGEK